jgi:peptide/nickel transport system substrate-binding protein
MKDKILQNELKYEDLDHVDKGIVDKVVRGGYSRRDALKLMVATGITMAAAENILVSGSVAYAATPKKGGSVRMANPIHGPDDQTDPMMATSGIDYGRGRAVYNGLVQHANDLSPQPELATSFEPNADATEWTFKLRKGVEWHDGTKFTADDVVWSMNRHLTDDSTSVIKSVLATIKEWKKVGSHEVKAVMHSSNSDLPTVLGMFQNKVVKNGTKGDWIGTGPFTMESFKPRVK